MKERLMVFIDGTNLLRTLGKVINADFRADKPPEAAINLAMMIVRGLIQRISVDADFYSSKLLRIYWFSSFQGNEEYEIILKEHFRKMRVEPVIFKKNRGREKRVDIAISREMLINAFNQNYDLGILVAGDEDYVDLVQDIKRFGIRIIGSFFNQNSSQSLKLAVDNFHELHVWGENRRELVEQLGGTLPE
ncbi:MAG: NYN domain-containing protein [Thermodesulfobacteriota bacterium]|nr:NYN domain-containing protein [Thermodesulfobacteriota bacterium]